MPEDLGTLLLRVGITGIQDVSTGLRKVATESKATGASLSDLTGEFKGLSLGGLAAIGTLGAMVSQIGSIGRALNAVTGVGIAGRFERLQVGFETLLGSAGAARDLLEDLAAIGARTDFNTEGLIEFSRGLIATGSNAESLKREIRAITDTAAALGLQTFDVGRMTTNMGQIRSVGAQERDIQELQRMGVNLDKIIPGGKEALKGMTGQQAFNAIITGMEKAFGGAAQRNAGTFLGLVQNINETFSMIMKPTGELLLPALKGISTGIKGMGERLKTVNELTGGGAGLVGMLGLLGFGMRALVKSALEAAASIRMLVASLNTLAISGAGGGGIGGLGGGFDPNVRQGIPRYGGGLNKFRHFAMTGNLRGLGGMALGGLKGLGMGALKFAKSGLGLGLIADLGGNLLGNAIGGGTGSILKNLGTYAGLGAGLGSFFPGAGTAIGAGIGGAFGVGKGIYDMYQGKGAAAGGSDPAVKELKDVNKNLQDIKGSVIGGGSRVQLGRSVGEIEIALARLYNPRMGVA